jgi:hypothetical protein
MPIEVIVGSHFCKTSHHIIATITLHIIVAFDTIVSFVIPLVALLTSTPVM